MFQPVAKQEFHRHNCCGFFHCVLVCWFCGLLVLRGEECLHTSRQQKYPPQFQGWVMLCPQGGLNTSKSIISLNTIKLAYAYTVRLLKATSQPDYYITIQKRNKTIRERYKAGESLSVLAAEFGLSPQRVYQIVNNRHH